MSLVGNLSPDLSALSALTTMSVPPPPYTPLLVSSTATIYPSPCQFHRHHISLSMSPPSSSLPRSLPCVCSPHHSPPPCALMPIDLGMNLFNVELSDFVAPLLQIKSVAYIDLSSNYLYGSVPEALLLMPNLELLSLASNYLTGVLPSPPSVALKTLDVSGNLFAGSFPSFASQLDECSAGGNCLSSSGHCSSGEGAGGEQRGEEACAVCGGSMKSMQVNLCGEGRVCVAEMDTVPESADEAGSVTVTMGGSSGDESAKESPTGASEDGAKSSADSGADSGAKSGAGSGSEEKEGDSGGDNTLAGSEDKDGDEEEGGEEEGNVEEGEEEISGEGEEDTTSAAGEKGSGEGSSGVSQSDGSAKSGEEGGTEEKVIPK
ncbi:unnamed protein product [Closterium sp. Naga37s-1]|nr:unnamed protein product [Closterium sp. Naga37s-1]